MTIEYENQLVNFYSNEKEGFALQIWLSPPQYTEFYDAQEKLIKVFEKKKLKRLIGDLRLLGDLSEKSIIYVNTVLHPRLQKLEKVASIVPEETFIKMILESKEQNFRSGIDTPNFRSFSTLEAALAWIREP